MFSLIISIIAIALVAALAGASVYYGGSAFNEGTAGADASTLINGGQQINGAAAIAESKGVEVTAMTDLEGEYLSQVPSFKGEVFTADGSVALLADTATNDVITSKICEEINTRAGKDTPETPYADAASVTGLFGCHTDTNGETFLFKL